MKIIPRNPPDHLKSVIKHMWIIEEDGALDIQINSFPVGYSFINVIDGDGFKILQNNNEAIYRSYLAGPNISHFSLEMAYIKRALTIQLQPFALPLLFSLPANEFYNQVLPVSDFNEPLSGRLEELISSNLSSEQVLDAITKLFAEISCIQLADTRVSHALSLLITSKGRIPISTLADEVNLSKRRMQQLFKHYFGVPAKSYGRIIKMQYHTYQWLNGTDLDMVIPDGYYDQSHFIHELRKQTGMLPSDFFDYVTDERNKQAYLNSNLYHHSPFIGQG